MKKIILIIILYFIAGNLFAASLADSAKNAYTNGNYALSAMQYEKLLEKNPLNKDIYYNLGNAYYRLGKTSKAILNYERALRLDPVDKDIKHNLEIARQDIEDEIDAIPELFFIAWLDKLNHAMSIRNWAILSIFFFLVFIGFTAWRLFRKKYSGRKFISGIAIVGIIISIISLLLANRLHKQTYKQNEAIVFEDGLVKSSPSETGVNLFEIHEGLKVKVIDSLNNYTQIRLSDGKKGWIRSRNIENIRIKKNTSR